MLGLNRDLHGKATGVRTLGLVCLGSALAVLSIHAASGADASRVIQGIVTGVGFLGAGGRNYHAHASGDAINAVLAAAGYNYRRLLEWLRFLLLRILIALALAAHLELA